MANHEENNMSQLPLSDVVLCCTAIPPDKRTELASIASQMGAAHTLDLTSNVTHLIVGDPDTPKYKYVARERTDVKIISPEWVEAVRLSWMEGGETDVVALEQQYRLPTFAGLKICLTGFEDGRERENLIKTITANGAIYSPDLTKSVTHLVALGTTSKKYQYAQQWDVKIVGLEWLSDSVERGMILDHSSYHPLVPHEQRGENAWVRRPVRLTSPGKRLREGNRNDPTVDGKRRKLRRTASAKLGSQNEGIWCDIVGKVPEPRFVAGDEWDENVQAPNLQDGTKHGVAPSTVKGETTHLKRQGELVPKTSGESYATSVGSNRGIFSGMRFLLRGFDERKTTILRNHLGSHDGKIISFLDQQPTSFVGEADAYMIVPHDFSTVQISKLGQVEGVVTVTEWWVEQCLHRKAWVEPRKNVLSTPFSHFPISAFQGMVICSTSFNGVDLLHVAKVVTLMGAIYDEYLTPKASVLVCNSALPSREKLRHAHAWKIPAVSADWLWECIRRGERADADQYLVSTKNPVPQPSTMPSAATGIAVEGDTKVKRSKSDVPGGAVKEEEPRQPPAKQSKGMGAVSCTTQTKPLTTVCPIQDDVHSAQAILPVPQNDIKQWKNSLDDSVSRPLRHEQKSVLQPIPPEVNSSLKSGSPSLATIDLAPSAATLSLAAEPDPKDGSDSLKSNIADLLAHKQATVLNRPASGLDSRPRRKRALLGRAPSDLSNRSNSISRASSTDMAVESGITSNAPDGSQSIIASQRVTYEDPEVLKQRERMVKRMTESADQASEGKHRKKKEEETRSIGVVKDTAGDAMGVAGRLRTTTRKSDAYG